MARPGEALDDRADMLADTRERLAGLSVDLELLWRELTAGGKRGSGPRGMKRMRTSARLRALVPTVIGGTVLALLAVLSVRAALEPGPWQRVLATREGLIGRRTSTGHVISAASMFVALPHPLAVGKHVELRYGTRALVVSVDDVGPWNVDDDYWTRGKRPASESGRGRYRTPTNRAGIDLSDAVFHALGLRDNDWVEWRFVHKGYLALPWL